MPKSNRICGKHLVDGVFSAQAMDLIEPTQDSFQLSGIVKSLILTHIR